MMLFSRFLERSDLISGILLLGSPSLYQSVFYGH